MNVQNLRISEKGKRQLVTLKRYTGIKNWNVLCRWALCMSLAEKAPPPVVHIPADSTVEMSWKVFGGSRSELLAAALKMRCQMDGLPPDRDILSQQLRLHVHRGLGYLAGSSNLRSIRAQAELAA